MPGEDAVRPSAAYRQGRSEEMPHAPIQSLLRSAVVDGQVHTDLRDFNVAHDPVAPHIQQAVIALAGLLQRLLGECFRGAGQERFVVGHGRLFCRYDLAVIHLLHSLFIASFHKAAGLVGVGVAEERIERHSQSEHGGNQENENFGSFLHLTSFQMQGGRLPGLPASAYSFSALGFFLITRSMPPTHRARPHSPMTGKSQLPSPPVWGRSKPRVLMTVNGT